MPADTKMLTMPTLQPLYRRLLALAARHFGLDASASLHELDRRALADIGVDPSEIASIEAESRGRASRTRRRIVADHRYG